MLNSDAIISAKIFTSEMEMKPTRDGFGAGVVVAGQRDPNVVVLCADLKESTRAEEFEKAFPDRFVEMGVAEQNMATVAAGMALAGKIPFITSYAAFSPGRNYEQIRTTVALNDVPVKICGMHAGVSVGPDGATHQMLEDIAMMRVLPNMTVVVPADAEEARKATMVAATTGKPIYLRFGRSATPVLTTVTTPFVLGKALTLWNCDAPRLAILSTGSTSHAALVAAERLSRGGIGVMVLHFATVKPLDETAVLAAAKRAGQVLTVEEHQIAGGFGSAVAECLAEHMPTRVVRLGVRDQFGQSGDPDELLAHYGIDAKAIEHATRRMLSAHA